MKHRLFSANLYLDAADPNGLLGRSMQSCASAVVLARGVNAGACGSGSVSTPAIANPKLSWDSIASFKMRGHTCVKLVISETRKWLTKCNQADTAYLLLAGTQQVGSSSVGCINHIDTSRLLGLVTQQDQVAVVADGLH